MKSLEWKDQLKGTFIIPIALALVLIPFSMLIGWNLVTLVLFWFVLLPALAVYLPIRTSKNKNHLLKSLAGLLLFYACIIFMIYDHYQTDYFQVMMISCGINVILITVIILGIKPRQRTL